MHVGLPCWLGVVCVVLRGWVGGWEVGPSVGGLHCETVTPRTGRTRLVASFGPNSLVGCCAFTVIHGTGLVDGVSA